MEREGLGQHVLIENLKERSGDKSEDLTNGVTGHHLSSPKCGKKSFWVCPGFQSSREKVFLLLSLTGEVFNAATGREMEAQEELYLF